LKDQVKTRKKLIEVALPLEAINSASAKEKSIRHGHPSTLHLWWARRPLAAARAIIFAQMVDDPSSHPDLFPTVSAQERERKRLFKIIQDLVKWENTTDEVVLDRARAEIWQSWRSTCADNAGHPHAKKLFDRHKLPAFHDPFAGGGAIPLEAQRLGLESYATDLNPVAILINKAMIEIPPMFVGSAPINPEWQRTAPQGKAMRRWEGAQGLANDVRYYGKWMRDEAERRIGHFYPPVIITQEMTRDRPDLRPYLGKKLKVIAWIWARTVKSPNPAFARVDVPLASTFMLSEKGGRYAYVQPLIGEMGYRFEVKVGTPKQVDITKRGTKLSRGANFECVMSGTPISSDYIKGEGVAGRMGSRMMAIVAQGDNERLYLPPLDDAEQLALAVEPSWRPETPLADDPRNFWTVSYGLTKFADLFTSRQLLALTTFSDLVQESRDFLNADALTAGLIVENAETPSHAKSAQRYAKAVMTYLAFAVSKAADRNTSLCFWETAMDRLRGTFGRQVLPMIWDYAETNPFAGAGGDIYGTVQSLCEVIDNFSSPICGAVCQADAANQTVSAGKVVSTDPPYYDNIGYADLSDFFYVWLRRTLKSEYPDIFRTVAVPKAEELVATPYRHGGKAEAEEFFMTGMTLAMQKLAQQAHPAFPVTIYYAFKQTETKKAGTASTGWETFLDAVIRAGFAVTGTWPIRTEQMAGLKSKINALASSIVLVCHPRPSDAAAATRRELLNALKDELPSALVNLQKGNIAPVDLAQAAIGPGMAVYTRFARVIDAEGNALTVGHALAIINDVLDEVLAEQEGDFDSDTRWALTWFDQFGFAEGEYGVAETLANARNTSVEGMRVAGILASKSGKVRLLRPDELQADWNPETDERLTAWEIVHHLVRTTATGEAKAAELVGKLGPKAEVGRELAYRLYNICERKKRPQEALAYNGLVQSWPEILRLARQAASADPVQAQSALFSEIV
jgi:putative DNA methylase